MFKQAHDTTLARTYRTDKLDDALRKAVIQGDVYWIGDAIDEEGETVLVYALIDSNSDVPSFTLPRRIDISSRRNDMVIFDARGSAKLNSSSDNGYVVSSHTDWNVQRITSFLSISEAPCHRDLYNSSDLPMYAFIQWISESMARSVGLDTDSQLRVASAAGLFYWSLHNERILDLTERDVVKIATRIARASGIGAHIVIEHLTNARYIANVKDFLDFITTNIENSRLDKFKDSGGVGLFLNLMSNSLDWRGSNGKELLSVAIEFMPLFHAMVAISLNNKGRFSKLLDRYRPREAGDQYLKSIKVLVGTSD